ncbi:hypothetical protein [Pseudomonas aeruginosa]|uniref:hypothetical protein n=2 Tax=Pseudomonas aeruginosa TaxID=287 RepID=UPI00128F6940|nr:hypothetical protein [Pseudomonas aeruginosa]
MTWQNKGVEMNLQLELMNKNISMLQTEIKYLQIKMQESRHVGDQEKHSQMLEQQNNAAYYLEHATKTKTKIIMNIHKSWRRQKLSATPDLSGTVLPYVLFRTQR